MGIRGEDMDWKCGHCMALWANFLEEMMDMIEGKCKMDIIPELKVES